MNTKISDYIRFSVGKASADIVTPVTTAYVDASDARRFLAVLSLTALADTKTATIQLKQATASNGAGAKNLGTAVVYTASGAVTDVVITAEAQINDLDNANGFTYVAATVSSNNTAAVPAAVTLLKGDTRFNL